MGVASEDDDGGNGLGAGAREDGTRREVEGVRGDGIGWDVEFGEAVDCDTAVEESVD